MAKSTVSMLYRSSFDYQMQKRADAEEALKQYVSDSVAGQLDWFLMTESCMFLKYPTLSPCPQLDSLKQCLERGTELALACPKVKFHSVEFSTP